MRVLHFYFAELGSLGGVEGVVRNLAERFSERGCPAGIAEISPAWKPRRLLSSSIPAWGIAAPSFTELTRPRSWASFLRSTAQLQRIVREFKPDIIHVHYPLTQALPCVGVSVMPHTWRLVVTVHGSDIRKSPFEDPRIRTWQARLFDRADAVTAVSHSLLEDTVSLYPRVAGKGHTIYNSVRECWFQPRGLGRSTEDKYILFVGRLHNVKGVDILLEAWNQICARFADISLWLVGEGPERERLQSLADTSGITSRVRFLGGLPQEKLPLLYREAEAVVLPSRSEGMPLTLLEAGASGALFVVSSIPGISEIVEEGKTGFLAEPESSTALAAAISRALQISPTTSEMVKEALRTKVRERFSEEVVVSKYLKLFDELLGRGHGPE